MRDVSKSSVPSNPTLHPKPDELPGGEMPRAVYRSVVAAFVWMMLAAWLTFAHGRESNFVLAAASLLILIFLMLPFLIYVTASHHMTAKQETLDHFLHSEVDTATGWLSGRQAWVEIAVIPAALALAATLIGMAYALTG
jgi:Ca2+/Na+ antiporter